MRNVLLLLEYDGTNYEGWQRQAKGKTIQETIEKALKQVLQKRVSLIGTGRTDSGVHAQGQVANFKTESTLLVKKIQAALNGILPTDIRVKDAKEVDLNFHSRFNAKAKIYRYTILNRRFSSVFYNRFSHLVPYKLDVGLMQREAKSLLGRHDFKAFQAQASDKKMRSSIRAIKKLKVSKPSPCVQGLGKDDKFIYIDIEANGFLYNMARNIVGTLIEIGRKKLAPGALKEILRKKDRKLAGPTAPARGLCLIEVKY